MKRLEAKRAVPQRRVLILALLAGTALTMPTPARADPISAAIVGTFLTIGTTAATIATAVLTAVLTTVGGILLNSVFGPKRNGQDRQASVAALAIGEHPREAIFGEAATGGSLADAFNYGGKDGTDWEVLRIVLADHRCHSLTGFFVNDVYVPYTGDGSVAGYAGQLQVFWRPGTEDQVPPALVTTYGGLTAADNMAGCAHVVVAYKADKPDSKAPIWPGGRPGFLWVVKGKLCYIPRLDDTVPGGEGAHRWDDPDTWEWTDNPIDCRYNWMRGVYACDRIDQPGMLLVGRGLSAIEAPPERTIAAANVCDEAVALKAGGTEKRYRVNLVVRADEEYIETEGHFAAACAGLVLQRQGGVEIEPGSARSVVAEITDADFVVGEKVMFNRFRSDKQRINSVIPRYVEPAQRWVEHAAPIRRDLADIAEDGGPREDTISLSGVTSNTQAQRIGEIKRRLSRLERSGSGTLGPRFAHLEEGDWIGWTSARHLGGARVVFRISSYSLGPTWRNVITFEEVEAEAYDYVAATDEITPGSVAEQSTPPTIDAPDPADWSVTGVSLTSDGGTLPALVFAGEEDLGSDYIDQILFEYRLTGASEWTGPDVAGPGVRNRVISSVVPGASYEGAVTYVVGGIPTDRLVLGPVTVGDIVSSGYAQGLKATLLTADPGGAGEADLTWRQPVSAGWSYVQAMVSATDDFGTATPSGAPPGGGLGADVAVTLTGLSAGVRYVWAATYDADDVLLAVTASVSVTVT